MISSSVKPKIPTVACVDIRELTPCDRTLRAIAEVRIGEVTISGFRLTRMPRCAVQVTPPSIEVDGRQLPLVDFSPEMFRDIRTALSDAWTKCQGRQAPKRTRKPQSVSQQAALTLPTPFNPLRGALLTRLACGCDHVDAMALHLLPAVNAAKQQ